MTITFVDYPTKTMVMSGFTMEEVQAIMSQLGFLSHQFHINP